MRDCGWKAPRSSPTSDIIETGHRDSALRHVERELKWTGTTTSSCGPQMHPDADKLIEQARTPAARASWSCPIE